MESHQIKFPQTTHYYTIGQPSKKIKQLFFVFHGYGQLASRIIRKFDQLDDRCLIVAPEGFSRFYWNESKGIVGASWMTKKDRLVEIEDYCNYLEYLYSYFTKQLSDDVQINLLGFSQGGATAVRWVERYRPKIDNLILWGAGFPMDLNYLPLKKYLSDIGVYLVYGKQDEYLTEERIDKHQGFTQQQELAFETIWFEGKHVIERSVLHQLVERL